MKKKWKLTLTQGCGIFMVAYIVFAVGLYFIAGDEFKYRVSDKSIVSVAGNTLVTMLQKDDSVEQTFVPETDIIGSFSLKFSTYGKQNTGTLRVKLLDDANKNVLLDKQLDISGFQDNSYVTVKPDKRIESVKGKSLRILIISETGTQDNTVTLWFNNSAKIPNQQLFLNGRPVNGVLCFNVSAKEVLQFGRYYFEFMGAIGIVLLAYCGNLVYRKKKEKKSFGLNIINAFTRYEFLLSQLVSRDFKTKYKRSVLGVLWSFLNPLLSMTVQYVIFSTIFKSNIPNFAVYLLIGIVFFNFFSEATSMGLIAIVGNSSLITKVYIPKYIFPVSRTLSSTINLLISMIPLILVVLLTRTPITPALLLLPFSIMCAIVFCIGMSFILSAAMVFFRDMQFLWGVVSMLWMYATPIFYPESILPPKYMVIFKMNPLYHFIRFSRTIILEGVSPEPKAYLFCLIAAFVPLAIGAAVFKKTQDKFILNM
jgi:ABC-2 type transport system permease protein